jgi:hypothetical protein
MAQKFYQIMLSILPKLKKTLKKPEDLKDFSPPEAGKRPEMALWQKPPGEVPKRKAENRGASPRRPPIGQLY